MNHPPNSICILRLSAIGDVTHMIPVVRTLQKHWPKTQLTWVIGKNEAQLVHDIADVNFIIFDKSNAWASYCSLARQMKNQKFDVLICAQVSLRANLISMLIPAKLKLGYDREHAKDMHTAFIHESIAATPKQHVLDSFFSFIEHLGLKERELIWNYEISKAASEFANRYIKTDRKNVIISPCSSHSKRNWCSKRYAAVADYAIAALGANVLLCGGVSDMEQRMRDEIPKFMHQRATNLIGVGLLEELLALLKKSDVIITPDSGPAHMATGCGTEVLGLYAASNPVRSGPYLSIGKCINKYDEAAKKFKNQPASHLKWGAKLEYEGVMDLITVDEVTSQLENILTHNTKS